VPAQLKKKKRKNVKKKKNKIKERKKKKKKKKKSFDFLQHILDVDIIIIVSDVIVSSSEFALWSEPITGIVLHISNRCINVTVPKPLRNNMISYHPLQAEVQ